MTISYIKERARLALSERWGISILAGLIASFFGATSFSGGGSIEFKFGEDTDVNTDVSMEDMLARLGITEDMLALIAYFLVVAAFIGLIVMVAKFIIGSAVGVGYAKFNLDLVDFRTPSVGTLFSRFRQMGTAICANLLATLHVMLFMLLLIVPGIIVAFNYAMVNYVLAENPGFTASEALAESKRIMKGHRFKFFCLNLSFIGWSFLSVLTLGVGFIWLVPYVEASHAAFYREISHPSVNYI